MSLAAAAAFGVTNAPAPADSVPSGNKFLFVLETSAATARLDHGGRQAVVDLIYTGIFGQMREGDSFAVWNYNEQVFAGVYPMQFWKPEDMELASGAGLFLKGQAYEKKGEYEAALKYVAELIKGVKDVNVFILSDPSVRPAKDLLGDKYTREFIEKARKARLAKQPVVTTLVARNGGITNWIVTIGNDAIKLPAVAIPLHPKPKPVIVAQVKPAAPRIARAPIIMTGSRPVVPEAKPKLGQVLSASTDVSYLSSLQTNAAPTAKSTNVAPASLPVTPSAKPPPPPSLPEKKTVSVPATQATAASGPTPVRIEPTTPVVMTRPTPVPVNVVASTPVPVPTGLPPANLKPIPSPAKQPITPAVPLLAEPEAKVASAPAPEFLPLAEPVKVAARERGASASSSEPKLRPAVAAANPVSVHQESFSPIAMVVIGALLLLLAGALSLLFWQFWQRPARPSFISQSMEHQ